MDYLKSIRPTLITYAIWASPTWQEGNEDDVTAAESSVDKFIAFVGNNAAEAERILKRAEELGIDLYHIPSHN